VSATEGDTRAEEIPPEEQHMGVTRLARRVFVWFIITFALARSAGILMSLGRLHDFYLRFGQTHVHHLNYGIFILAAVGAYLLFLRPDETGLARAAILYGVGLALTFDEFGMWLHLDDVYWQRASFDAMILIAAILGLIMAAPTVRRFRLHHWIWTIVMAIAVIWFITLLMKPFQRMHERIAPWFRRMDHPAMTDTTTAVDSADPRSPNDATAHPPAGPSQRIRK